MTRSATPSQPAARTKRATSKGNALTEIGRDDAFVGEKGLTPPEPPPQFEGDGTPVAAPTASLSQPPPPSFGKGSPAVSHMAKSDPAIENEPADPVFLGSAESKPPGVHINRDGNAVDAHGVLLSFKALKDRFIAHEVSLIGKAVETPAEVLKAAALDVRLPLAVRIDAAKNAAPYYDRKKPVAIDGGEDPLKPDGPGLPMRVQSLQGLSDGELNDLQVLLDKATPAGGSLH